MRGGATLTASSLVCTLPLVSCARRAGPTLDTDSRTLYVTTSGDQSLNGTLFGLNLDECTLRSSACPR